MVEITLDAMVDEITQSNPSTIHLGVTSEQKEPGKKAYFLKFTGPDDSALGQYQVDSALPIHPEKPQYDNDYRALSTLVIQLLDSGSPTRDNYTHFHEMVTTEGAGNEYLTTLDAARFAATIGTVVQKINKKGKVVIWKERIYDPGDFAFDSMGVTSFKLYKTNV